MREREHEKAEGEMKREKPTPHSAGYTIPPCGASFQDPELMT